jgi:hypothetical protein
MQDILTLEAKDISNKSSDDKEIPVQSKRNRRPLGAKNKTYEPVPRITRA